MLWSSIVLTIYYTVFTFKNNARDKCEARGCLWSPSDEEPPVSGIPWCFYPTGAKRKILGKNVHDDWILHYSV